MDGGIIDQNEICALFVGLDIFSPFLGSSFPRLPAMADCSDLPGVDTSLPTPTPGRTYLSGILRRMFPALADISICSARFCG